VENEDITSSCIDRDRGDAAGTMEGRYPGVETGEGVKERKERWDPPSVPSPMESGGIKLGVGVLLEVGGRVLANIEAIGKGVTSLSIAREGNGRGSCCKSGLDRFIPSLKKRDFDLPFEDEDMNPESVSSPVSSGVLDGDFFDLDLGLTEGPSVSYPVACPLEDSLSSI